MKCWNCGATLDEPSWGKLSFRAICDVCNAALHCCKNCIYYKPGQPNDCAVPGTDYVADRTATNFCEDFKLLGQAPAKKVDSGSVAKRLFGDDVDDAGGNVDPKKRFDSLFGESSEDHKA